MKKIDKFSQPTYKGIILAKITVRSGSLSMLNIPSRVVKSVVYPDGRRVWDK
jgi:hypothetical protein